MTITLYGLKNCDTCRKARQWLAGQGIDHDFHDLREDGLDAGRLRGWLEVMDWETLLNRRSTTWRQLDPAEREPLDAARAEKLMLAHPALVKRPVLEHSTGVLVGFSAAKYETALAGAD